MKTLEASIAERLYQMTSTKTTDRDAFVNYLTIITCAEIKRDHEGLSSAVYAAARELKMHGECMRALHHIEGERIRVGGKPEKAYLGNNSRDQAA